MLTQTVLLCLALVALAGAEAVLPDDDCSGIQSRVCQNFNEERQNAINLQVNKELEASYVYMAMASYFARDDPHLKGFAKFFADSSSEEREHAMKLAEYQSMRGGVVKYTAIQSPAKQEWKNGLAAMEDALKLEKDVNAKLLKLHELAEEGSDPHLQDFLETHYLHEQVESIRELSGYVTQLKRLHSSQPGLGEHIFDQELLKN